LAQGLLTNRYLDGIPKDSRAAKSHGFLQKEDITSNVIDKIRQLSVLAENRNQTLAEMALAWLLNKLEVASVIIGVSSVKQLKDNLDSLRDIDFTTNELTQIETILQ
jgi:L-glyceraldehyde 3-phosphate reductase